MPRHSLQEVIREQHQKAASSSPPPKQGWLARMLYADKSAKGWLPTRQLSIFVPTLFVCMMATTLVMKSKLSVKFEDIDETTKKKCEGEWFYLSTGVNNYESAMQFLIIILIYLNN